VFADFSAVLSTSAAGIKCFEAVAFLFFGAGGRSCTAAVLVCTTGRDGTKRMQAAAECSQRRRRR
jgi:hypothetical protein